MDLSARRSESRHDGSRGGSGSSEHTQVESQRRLCVCVESKSEERDMLCDDEIHVHRGVTAGTFFFFSI